MYDLTVGGCPEFFAGGVLVHNSVALAAWLGERFPAWGPGDISSGDSGFRAELEAALGPTPDLDRVEW